MDISKPRYARYVAFRIDRTSIKLTWFGFSTTQFSVGSLNFVTCFRLIVITPEGTIPKLGIPRPGIGGGGHGGIGGPCRLGGAIGGHGGHGGGGGAFTGSIIGLTSTSDPKIGKYCRMMNQTNGQNDITYFALALYQR